LEIREEENSVAWFYRILRNATIDHYRRRASKVNALKALSIEVPQFCEPEIKGAACECIGVIGDSKPEYRTAIEQVDLGEIPLEKLA